MVSRLLWSDPFWNGKRRPFLVAILMAGVMIVLLFLGNFSYLYGSLFRSGSRVHNLNILAVDYDGGLIGEALSTAYEQLRGDAFPELQFHPVAEYPAVADMQEAVCRGDFWGAVFTHPSASSRLSQALGGGTAAAMYNSSDTITYVFNGAHYPAVQLGDIQGNLQTLIATAAAAYSFLNGTEALAYLNGTDRNAAQAIFNPIRASSIDLKPTNQGTRVLYNTVSIVLPIIQQFFFLMALNGIHNQFDIYGRLSSTRVGILRMIISAIYTMVSALTTTGYIWAFREDWDVSGGQFVLVWMAYWLYMHVNFVVLDAFTAFVPLSFLPFFVLTWAILNVTGSIYPSELSSGFYKLSYALPGNDVYAILVQIESGGCNNKLSRALPVLLSWEIVGLGAAICGVYYRNNKAMAAIVDIKEEELAIISHGGQGKERGLTSKARHNSGAAGPGLPMPFQAEASTPGYEEIA